MAASVPVYLEAGTKRVFAASLDWPGWCRSARTADAALDTLAEYADRYRPVAQRAGARFPASPSFEVVEEVTGSASTDFGVPGSVPNADLTPLTATQARRLAGLVDASWEYLEHAAAIAPAVLRKGPRGGGRDRDAMVSHVRDAEDAYARKLGLAAGHRDRAEMLALLGAARAPEPLAPKGWPPRYAARRIAWHALDHAWEMEDRSS